MPQQRATLSDLLADDVRDYFRREGVESDKHNETPHNGKGRRKRQTAASIMSNRARAPLNSSENMANGPQSPNPPIPRQNAPKSPPRNQMQQQMQQSYSPNQSTSEHRRQSSGSSPKHLSLADAEFLRRYAEEKERANYRILPNRRGANATVPKDFVDPKLNGKNINGKSNTITAMMRPYNSLASSSRPPTVAGSHRPGLASIDNDDWEEDDRLERRDRRKAERHARKKSGASAASLGLPNGHLRNGSVSSGHARKKSSVSLGSGGHLRIKSGLSSENGSLVMLPPSPCQQYNQLPYQPGIPQNCYQYPPGIPLMPGYEMSPGDTLCYSSSSQSHIHPASVPLSPWEAPRRYSRKDSASTFVRKESTDTYQNIRSSTASSVSGGTANDSPKNKRGHVRPLSYLSASSESGSKEDHLNGAHPNFPNVGPSPPSSSNDTRFSRSESDGQSALFGSSIVSFSSPGEKSVQFQRANGRGCNIREESSDESESGSSYTSSSSDGESSDSTDFENGYSNGGYSEKDGFAVRKNNYSSIPPSKTKKRRESIGIPLRLDDALKVVWDKLWAGFVVMELYISNMPSLVGSLALAWSSLGVDWFKWYEETFDACHPTDYHNALCVYPEFPGCFTCDTTRSGYQFTLHFHYLCSIISVTMAFLLIGKIIVAFPVVRDELANPTTAAPLGLLCMALEKSFGGNFGVVGMSFTFAASALQTVMAIWFIFISIVYKTLPEPSWFPNTTGLGLAAAKIYLYWTPGGYFLSILSILLFVMFYFVALYRIHTNIKISAPVCWVQISGPAVILYGFSVFGQPGSDEDELELMSEENKQHFISVHQKFFMPFMHFFFACCMVSMASALYCLSIRFKKFRENEFSPAHVGFCAPVLSHANALQCYRSAVKRFSLLPHDHAFKTFLYQYWTFSLTSGTVMVVILTWRFVACLPTWCQIDVDDDEIPPEPEECLLTKLLEKGDAKDEMTQDYVSAAVLQANESGALVRVLRDGKMKYMRSRRMPSMGFDPIMTTSQLLNERERLLQHLTYAASLQDRRGTNSFDDTLSSFYERDNSMGSSSSSLSSRRSRRKNFMSFDASAMMRGGH